MVPRNSDTTLRTNRKAGFLSLSERERERERERYLHSRHRCDRACFPCNGGRAARKLFADGALSYEPCYMYGKAVNPARNIYARVVSRYNSFHFFFVSDTRSTILEKLRSVI